MAAIAALALSLSLGTAFAAGDGSAADARGNGWLSSWPSFFGLWNSSKNPPPARDAEQTPPSSEETLIGLWRSMLLELRPESQSVIGSTPVSFVSFEKMREHTGRDSEAHYLWRKGEVIVNRRLISALRAEVTALVGEQEADKKLAILTLHILDHEIIGHAGAVAAMREKYGKYVGIVLEEENYSYMTEAVGIHRCYANDYCREGTVGIRELIDKRHANVLKAIPGGTKAFDILVKSKGYHLFTAEQKAREYRKAADEIEARFGRRPGKNGAVDMRRDNANNLLDFYEEAFKDFEKALKAISP